MITSLRSAMTPYPLIRPLSEPVRAAQPVYHMASFTTGTRGLADLALVLLQSFFLWLTSMDAALVHPSVVSADLSSVSYAVKVPQCKYTSAGAWSVF